MKGACVGVIFAVMMGQGGGFAEYCAEGWLNSKESHGRF
jgi:hypothetical protein